jgi:hypothetical protein
MKHLHAISLVLSTWIFLIAFIADDLASLLFGNSSPEIVFELIKWDDLFLGLTLLTLQVVMATMEQLKRRHPGLKAMHYLNGILALWVTIAPFSVLTDYTSLLISHIVAGGLLMTFSLLQLILEE